MPSCLEYILPVNAVDGGLYINLVRFTNMSKFTLEYCKIFPYEIFLDQQFILTICMKDEIQKKTVKQTMLQTDSEVHRWFQANLSGAFLGNL